MFTGRKLRPPGIGMEAPERALRTLRTLRELNLMETEL